MSKNCNFFAIYIHKVELTAKTHVTDEFHSLAQIDCNELAIYQCLEFRLQLFTFSLSPLVGRQAASHKTTCTITLQK